MVRFPSYGRPYSFVLCFLEFIFVRYICIFKKDFRELIQNHQKLFTKFNKLVRIKIGTYLARIKIGTYLASQQLAKS